MPLKKMTKLEIECALGRLSELAASEGVRLEMTLYGGAVMLLAYNARPVTKDIDAIIHPPAIARRLIARVAAERGLHDGWVNDDVKQFVSGREAKNELIIANVSPTGLHVTRPTPKYLLAMKVMACRKPLPGYAGDYQDIAVLLRHTGLKTVDQVQAVIDTFFPDTVLSAPVQAVLRDIFDEILPP